MTGLYASRLPELSAVEIARKELRELERTMPLVPMPVDITDEEAFPEMARLRLFADANRDWIDADWEIGNG